MTYVSLMRWLSGHIELLGGISTISPQAPLLLKMPVTQVDAYDPCACDHALMLKQSPYVYFEFPSEKAVNLTGFWIYINVEISRCRWQTRDRLDVSSQSVPVSISSCSGPKRNCQLTDIQRQPLAEHLVWAP